MLVSVESDRQAETTASAAADLACQLGAQVVLLNVFSTGYSSSPDIVFNELEHRALCMKDATAVLEGLRERFMPDLKVETLVREGNPATEILKAAKACNADLIVIGTPSLGLLARVIFGNVVRVLMQHASCPVLTVGHRPRVETAHDDSA